MQNLANPLCYIAYASGFAIGTLIGIKIEAKTAIGKVVIRVITILPAQELIEKLRKKGFGVTDIPAKGAQGPVHVIYTIIERASVDRVITLINKYNPKAFYTVEDIRSVHAGVFPINKFGMKRFFPKSWKYYRKVKIYHRMNNHRKVK